MILELILLALASAIRPTSLAAVYALLSTTEPRRLMIAYLVAGLAVMVTFGVLVIWAFNGIDIQSGTDQTKGIAEIAGGAVALCFGVLVATGRVGGPHADDAPKAPGRWTTLLHQHLTIKSAALAGPATHTPGVFYLIALNLIIAHQPTVPTGLVDVVIYNVVWFVLPITALTMCIIDPEAARATVKAVDAWTRDHARGIVLAVSFAAGGTLLIHGAVTV